MIINTDTDKNDIDCILLIFNCKKYRYKALHQKETWLKELIDIIPYFHVIGDPELDNEYKFDLIEKMLYVKTLDDYISLPKKVIAAYFAINKEYNFKYIFKTDDDQFLNNIQLLGTIKKSLLKKEPRIHYAGHIINVDKPYLSQYCRIHKELPEYLPILQTRYCSGRFYILSDLAVQHLLTKRELIEQEYLEDYAIGFHLNDDFKRNILNINSDTYFSDIIL
jgi:hypothetical protein